MYRACPLPIRADTLPIKLTIEYIVSELFTYGLSRGSKWSSGAGHTLKRNYYYLTLTRGTNTDDCTVVMLGTMVHF